MTCPRCSLRLLIQSKRPKIIIPSRRAFHTSPRYQKLGAFTYAQEWQTGTYHFNKALTRTLPVASQKVDDLLMAYATQQKRRVDPSNPLYNQITRTNIAQQRRKSDRVLISKSTAKDFGDSIEVTAFVYDGVGAAEEEKEALRKKRMGVKEGQGAQGASRRGPAGRRRVGSGAGGAQSAGGGVGGPRRAGGVGTVGAVGGPRRTGGAGAPSGGTAFRSIKLGAGSSPVRRTTGATTGVTRSGPSSG